MACAWAPGSCRRRRRRAASRCSSATGTAATARSGPDSRALASAGHRVLLFDYRGYGGNAGTPTEMGLRADARAALAYLRSRPDIDAARIVYFGESLRAAGAAQLAAEHPPLGRVVPQPFTTPA